MTGLKLQSPKTNWGDRGEKETGRRRERERKGGGRGQGGPHLSAAPSLTVAAQRTQSAWCSDIKEEAAEAPSPKSCSLGAGGSPAPRLKAWCPRSPWLRSRRSLGARPRRRRSSPRASASTAAAPGRTGCGRPALLLGTGAPLPTSWVHSSWTKEKNELIN